MAAMQVHPEAAQALQLPAVLHNSAALEDGGPLFFDPVHGTWLYEGATLRDQLTERSHARSATRAGPRLVCRTAQSTCPADACGRGLC